MKLLPESMLVDMSLTNYNAFKKANKVVSGTDQANMVKRVGERTSRAVDSYLRKNGQYNRVKDYKWEFNLTKQDVANAWCMPGGKVMFYTGILPITLDETGLAVVMGHEIAHAVARHGNERMSQGLLATAGAITLAVAVRDKPQETQLLFMSAYGIGATVGVMLPFSRKHESEADRMGLIFMALAGYDPGEAVKFWQRMEANSKGAPPEFLSTHPGHQTRIQNIKRWLPEARKYYNK